MSIKSRAGFIRHEWNVLVPKSSQGDGRDDRVWRRWYLKTNSNTPKQFEFLVAQMVVVWTVVYSARSH